MPEDLDDAAIRERIHTISRQIDTILRKVAKLEPALFSDGAKLPTSTETAPSFHPPDENSINTASSNPEAPPRPDSPAGDCGKLSD
jgi:hypothetical protein